MENETGVLWVAGITFAAVIGSLISGISLWIRSVSVRLRQAEITIATLQSRETRDYDRFEKLERKLDCLPKIKESIGRLEGLAEGLLNNMQNAKDNK